MKNKYLSLSESISQEIDREILGELIMYSGISEKTAKQFEVFCKSNGWLFPSGIRIGMLSGEAKRDGKFIFPYEDAITLAQFKWSQKTINRRKELYPDNRRGFMEEGAEFSDHGYLLLRSISSPEEAKQHHRMVELVFKAFLAGAGARGNGFKKDSIF